MQPEYVWRVSFEEMLTWTGLYGSIKESIIILVNDEMAFRNAEFVDPVYEFRLDKQEVVVTVKERGANG